jgi:hypothetical protein
LLPDELSDPQRYEPLDRVSKFLDSERVEVIEMAADVSMKIEAATHSLVRDEYDIDFLELVQTAWGWSQTVGSND